MLKERHPLQRARVRKKSHLRKKLKELKKSAWLKKRGKANSKLNGMLLMKMKNSRKRTKTSSKSQQSRCRTLSNKSILRSSKPGLPSSPDNLMKLQKFKQRLKKQAKLCWLEFNSVRRVVLNWLNSKSSLEMTAVLGSHLASCQSRRLPYRKKLRVKSLQQKEKLPRLKKLNPFSAKFGLILTAWDLLVPKKHLKEYFYKHVHHL